MAFKLAINDYEASLREQHGGSGYTPRTSVFGLGLEAAFVESALGRKVHSESVGELAKAVKNMAQEFSGAESW